MLHDGHELHVPAADGLEELVHLEPPAFRGLVDRGHRVEFHAAAVQEADAPEDLVEGRGAALVLAVAVVDVLRPVDGNADEEAVLPEELRPFAVQEGPVGLDRVEDLLPVGILPLEVDGLAVEIQA